LNIYSTGPQINLTQRQKEDSPCSILGNIRFQASLVPVKHPRMSQLVWIFLPEIYVASRQPLQPSQIQDRELVPCQTQSLHAPELLQDGGDAAETVEG